MGVSHVSDSVAYVLFKTASTFILDLDKETFVTCPPPRYTFVLHTLRQIYTLYSSDLSN